MNLESKYDLDQTVWGISYSEFRQIVSCSACSSTGRLEISGETFVCPKCSGRSTYPRYAGQKWYVSVHGAVVGKIHLVRIGLAATYRSADDEGNDYMIDLTGIGSGTVWRERNLFPSLDEAQAECERRNSKLPSEDASQLTKPELI